MLEALTRNYLQICIEGLVHALDEADITSQAAVDSMLGAVSYMGGVLMTKGHYNEASRVWLHALAFLPFLKDHCGVYSVGTVLQQAHNVFERSAVASNSETECAIELEFEPALLTDALQTYCPTGTSSYRDVENSALPLNSSHEVQLGSQWDDDRSSAHPPAKHHHADVGAAVKDTRLPIPTPHSTLRRSVRAHSRVPRPLSLQVPVEPTTVQQHRLENSQRTAAQDRTLLPVMDEPVVEEVFKNNLLSSPVLDVSPQWSRQKSGEKRGQCHQVADESSHGCQSPDIIPRAPIYLYGVSTSSDRCPSPPTLCPATRISECDATPQLWDLPRIPATLICNPEQQLIVSNSIESPVCNMAKVSTASMEGDLLSGHSMNGMALTFTIRPRFSVVKYSRCPFEGELCRP